MKRALAAAVLLAAVMLLCIGSLAATMTVTESVHETAQAALEAGENGDTQRARALAQQLYDEWEQAENILGAFIRHEELELIGDSISSLSGLLSDDNLHDYLRECRMTLHYLEHVRRTELPLLPNIL